jgi:Uma2 family endonuclease
MPVAEPTWEIVELFPKQGDWLEEEYMRLPGNRLVEFSNRRVDVLPMPTQRHQKMLGFLGIRLFSFVTSQHLGDVLMAPFKIKLWPGKVRSPDVMFMLTAHSHRQFEQYWEGADLVMEVVSPDDPNRDTVDKKNEYAKAGIPEYWLVNPLDETITVFALAQGSSLYQEAGVNNKGDMVVSQLLEGFTVDVAAMFAL